MPTKPTALVPVSVADSLAELRRSQRDAKSRDDVRRATPEEIALAESQREPWHCAGHSSRSGLPCRLGRVHGMAVCRKHGGSLKRVKASAARRLAAITMPVIESMYAAATQTANLGAAVKAGTDLLDRGGVGVVVQAKVRSSRKTEGNKITVNIGFLGDGIAPPVIVLSPKNGPAKE